MQSATLLQWVLPLQAVKACEVPVRRAQPESVFDCECGEVGVGHEIRTALGVREKRSKNMLVAFRRQWNPDRLRCQPRLHLAPSGRHRNESIEDTGIASDPHERQQTGPRKSDPCGPVDSVVQLRILAKRVSNPKEKGQRSGRKESLF